MGQALVLRAVGCFLSNIETVAYVRVKVSGVVTESTIQRTNRTGEIEGTYSS